MKYSRFLVTGGAGFIGSNLVDKLIDNDSEVFLVDNLRTGRTSNIEHHYNTSKFMLENIDISSDRMKDIFRIFRPEVVFHLAAIPGVPFTVKEPVESNMSNLHGTVNLLNLSSKYDVSRFIFSSSSAVYGDNNLDSCNENLDLNPNSPYALQKKMSEEYCKFYSDNFNLETVSLRYFNVYGPRQYGDSPYSSVISSFLENIRNKKASTIYGSGEQYRDFCYVDDVVNANILVANSDLKFSGDIFNFGTGVKTSINNISKSLNLKNVKYEDDRPGDIFASLSDSSKFLNTFGFDKFTSLEDGLNKTSKWYLGSSA